ncbi:MAG: DUF1284 domain-containing protein [Actinomycetota bacterium]
MRLRPHHIFCSGFLPLALLDRGEEFSRAMHAIVELVRRESGTVVIVTEGPDQLCEYCPDLKNGRCENPNGDEEKVRRWDARIREGLGLSYGEGVPVKVLRALIEDRSPLDFCLSRCPWRDFCGVRGPMRSIQA